MSAVSSSPAFPPPLLVPENASSAVEHARRSIGSDAAAKLSSAFDDLRNAKREIETIINLEVRGQVMNTFGPTCSNFENFLRSAFEKLTQVRSLIL